MEEKKQGGSRKNSGRKKIPESEKKQVVNLYIQGAVIKTLGGKGKAAKMATEFLNEKAKQ